VEEYDNCWFGRDRSVLGQSFASRPGGGCNACLVGVAIRRRTSAHSQKSATVAVTSKEADRTRLYNFVYYLSLLEHVLEPSIVCGETLIFFLLINHGQFLPQKLPFNESLLSLAPACSQRLLSDAWTTGPSSALPRADAPLLSHLWQLVRKGWPKGN
jgi:hypothetical protein